MENSSLARTSLTGMNVWGTNVQDLVDADDFKTPKKVRIISFTTQDEEDDHVEVAKIGTLTPLNVKC
jgi:hypothetical protein